MELLDSLEFNPKLSETDYRNAGHRGVIPVIRSYRTQWELRDMIHYLLEGLPRAEVKASKWNYGRSVSRADEIKEYFRYILAIETSVEIVYITPTIDGYYYEKYDLEEGDFTSQGLCSFQDSNCIDSLVRGEIKNIDLYQYDPGSEEPNEIYIYWHRFPLSYFLDSKEGPKEVSKDEYFKYQESLPRYGRQEMEIYSLPELSGLIGEYLGGKTERKQAKS